MRVIGGTLEVNVVCVLLKYNGSGQLGHIAKVVNYLWLTCCAQLSSSERWWVLGTIPTWLSNAQISFSRSVSLLIRVFSRQTHKYMVDSIGQDWIEKEWRRLQLGSRSGRHGTGNNLTQNAKDVKPRIQEQNQNLFPDRSLNLVIFHYLSLISLYIYISTALTYYYNPPEPYERAL